MKYLFGILLLFGVGLAPRAAYSDKCKDPYIVIQNSSFHTVIIKRIKYYDGCDGKYRTEELSDRTLPPLSSYTWRDNLEYVQNCKIPKFQVYYWGICEAVPRVDGYYLESTFWSKSITPLEGGNVECKSGAKYTIILTNENCSG